MQFPDVRKGLLPACVLLLAGLFASTPAFAAACLRGANVAGAEFGEPGGAYGKAYIYPSQQTLGYLKSRGMNSIRLPFKWERLQPDLFGVFDTKELVRLRETVSEAHRLSMAVILDPHNYGAYRESRIGSSAVPVGAFADLWRQLAAEFRGEQDILLSLMNEPVEISAAEWLVAANAAIKAIRDTGNTSFILVPGTIWTGASHWFDPQPGGSNADTLTNVVDPLGHYGFEVHQYLDEDFSGTGSSCPRTGDALAALEKVAEWLEQVGRPGYLGEFGGTRAPDCLSGIGQMVGYINSRPDIWIGWSYWAAGDWWGDYPLSIQPDDDGRDKPQMTVLRAHLPILRSWGSECRFLLESR